MGVLSSPYHTTQSTNKSSTTSVSAVVGSGEETRGPERLERMLARAWHERRRTVAFRHHPGANPPRVFRVLHLATPWWRTIALVFAAEVSPSPSDLTWTEMRTREMGHSNVGDGSNLCAALIERVKKVALRSVVSTHLRHNVRENSDKFAGTAAVKY